MDKFYHPYIGTIHERRVEKRKRTDWQKLNIFGPRGEDALTCEPCYRR